MTIIEIRRLTVAYGEGPEVVQEVSLTVRETETVAIVGESGSGKSTILKAILGTLEPSARIRGEVLVDGSDVVGSDEDTSRALRGSTIGYVSQDPYGAMNPIMNVDTNIAEAWRTKSLPVKRTTIAKRLDAVHIGDADRRMRQPPFAWSGGMLQRGSVVTAGALEPAVVLADEPTSALDSQTARRVMDTLVSDERALVVVSHDVHLASEYADRVYTMANGRIVSVDSGADIRKRLSGIDEHSWLKNARRRKSGTPVLRARAVTRTYAAGGLAPVDLDVRRGEVVGVGGPSGCGKSTLLRVVAGIERPSAGTVDWDETGRPPPPGDVALVFQNALGSLNPRWPIYRVITEPLRRKLRTRMPKSDQFEVAAKLLERVGLASVDPHSRAVELSGGQAQRVAIARALVGDVRLLLADEPTAALDQASAERVLMLLHDLAADGLPIVMVSHDDDMLKQFTDTVIRLKSPEESDD
ncbi:peptide/nickel transport system ATP-binding protein [Antricoccus suffuscus]|uniref:Peptide/nickel transport system ATP-binding protein n=1 Tax=Antricoccus suffuscus TaxID=1629062 RepID=A0A2T0ZVV4_9ACTN|nr:ATP-binding cassette domain-containing protein [Antricoccus suffuscus]PRZ40479.1 peptide/nickel transport system ATP-binding protein [Antricoccus suffuscus]